jgi:aspartyl protease family protein
MVVRTLLIGALAVLGAVVTAQRLNALADPQSAHQVAAVATTQSAQASEGGETTIPMSSDGHWWADADIDGHPIHVLIDTGATAVSLTASDARALGIDPDNLNYAYPVMTANGPARAAKVRLGEVSVGNVEVSDVDAYVISTGLETSLLGMTYLHKVKMETTQDAMVLRE